MEKNVFEYKITSNKREKTFTIRLYHRGKLASKYRTIRQNKEDFNYYSNYATQNDIKQLLRSGDCYLVK